MDISPTYDRDATLEDVHAVRNILIDVGTGKRRIQDAEPEYTQLRSRTSRALLGLGIKDPNTFQSLWDWYGYWKANGLDSYQSRREYVSSLYKPVIDAIERAEVNGTGLNGSEPVLFSTRYGYAPKVENTGVVIREDAPEELRRTLVDIATQVGWEYEGLFHIASRIGKQSWESPEPRQSINPARVQLQQLISDWPWYSVYDFAEQIYSAMQDWEVMDGQPESDFERKLNDYFNYSGVAWQLRDGKLISRGSEAFETAIRRTIPAIKQAELPTAEQEIHEALSDLSRRPKPDLTGAIQHAMAALECVARTASGDPNSTLGSLLKRHPDLIPKPLDSAVEKAWGYASEMGRHVKEGKEPSREDAELIVGIAATVATFLTRKLPK